MKMFIAALVTIAKRGKQPRYPSMHKWIKKLWDIRMVGYYSAIKKECTWVS